MRIRGLGIALSVLAALVCGLLALRAWADSQARIVRLSDVEGNVEIDRNSGQGFEKAFLNMPITEGAKLRAKADGRAEVEFEDGSSLRIVPNTMVNFTQLSLQDSGSKINTVKLQEGTAYVNFLGKKDDQLTLNFARESVKLTQSAHLRVDLNDTDATVAVFKGEVDVQGPSGSVQVGSKHSASFDLLENDKYTLAKNYAEDPYDDWDKTQAQYHDRYATSNSHNGSYPYGYGVSDLNYYGNYYNAPGYGWMWQPYFAGVGWSPFSNGAWVWYPGFGYTWVSSYPWGWMPYRYGSWLFVPGYGWGWMPGGWNNWYTVPQLSGTPPNRFTPPQPPSGGGHGTVIVGKGPLGPVAPPHRMMIKQGSAGLDIPRGSISNLPKISQRVNTQGMATVHTAPGMRSTPGMPGFYTPRASGGFGHMSGAGGSHGSASHSSSSKH